jgi:hypothetical protein
MRFSHLLAGAGLAATVLAVSGPARADDQPFITLYTTDIQPTHGREFEQWVTWKAGRPGMSANEIQSRSEIEYGITDNLQGSLYLINDWTREHAPPAAPETSDFTGVSGELIWRLLNPYFDPVGLAVYAEPAWNPREHSIETKILAQKNFLDHRLRVALNINFEDTWERNATGGFDTSSALEFNLGASYNVTPDFSAGVEFDNERAFDGLILGGPASQVTSAYYLGPTVQYIGHPWAVTFGAQAQLPIAENSGGAPGAVVGGYVADAENFRVTLRLSTDF